MSTMSTMIRPASSAGMPPGGPLGPRQLADVAQRLAASPADWVARVRLNPDRHRHAGEAGRRWGHRTRRHAAATQGSRTGPTPASPARRRPGRRPAALTMALVYFDSSALVNLVVQETGSDLAAELWDGCDAALASRLAYPEVRAALAAAGRNHDLSDDDLDTAEEAWEQFWAAVRPVELTEAVERHAGQLARSYVLRGADAVHLASALAIGDPELIIAVWGRRLHSGATTAGLHIAPVDLS